MSDFNYYTTLFASHNNCTINDLIDEVISPLTSEENNFMLTRSPSMEEVKNDVFAMNGDGASGLKFSWFLFQTYWVNILGYCCKRCSQRGQTIT